MCEVVYKSLLKQKLGYLIPIKGAGSPTPRKFTIAKEGINFGYRVEANSHFDEAIGQVSISPT